MAKADELTQLKDIHLPDSIGWWPLAPGWYVVMLMILVMAIVFAYFLRKRRRDALAKNQALELLKNYTIQYEKERNAQLTSACISELLRRVALVYYPRSAVASLHGDGWIEFLNKTGNGVDFYSVKSMLLDSPFKTSETVDLQPLIIQAQLWIKQRSAPCSN
ncbi:DUF4381 domain-containing protein [Legionella fallonii]|uniref:DUF4381 domain-containing protein n=1 Tax=Legionella fallonii LLAP-10 TaxID=1212491 RepID=A0A098GAA6_9GAMM|nr:DUF4381 domain-containing protein [Legionella fallonii]CEG58917.1 conserved protein of unknown function [Legionella fallonii LLAP-10]